VKAIREAMHNPRVRRVNISAVTVKVQFPRSQSVFISFLESEIVRAILARRSTLYWVIPVESGDTSHGRRDGLHLRLFTL